MTRTFKAIADAGLTVKKSKCEFGKASVDFLGFHVGLGLIQPQEAKIIGVLKFPRPLSKKTTAEVDRHSRLLQIFSSEFGHCYCSID